MSNAGKESSWLFKQSYPNPWKAARNPTAHTRLVRGGVSSEPLLPTALAPEAQETTAGSTLERTLYVPEALPCQLQNGDLAGPLSSVATGRVSLQLMLPCGPFSRNDHPRPGSSTLHHVSLGEAPAQPQLPDLVNSAHVVAQVSQGQDH